MFEISGRSFIFNGVKVEFAPGLFDDEWTLCIDGVMTRNSVTVYLNKDNNQISYGSSHFSVEETKTHMRNVTIALLLIELKERLVIALQDAQVLGKC